MEKSRNQGNNPSQENLNQKNTSTSKSRDPRDTSAKGREEQVVSNTNQNDKAGRDHKSGSERNDSSRSSMTTDKKEENVSHRNPNSNSEENRNKGGSGSDKTGNDRGRQENLSDRKEDGNQRSNQSSGHDQKISTSNKEKGFREGQENNQEGLESDTEIPNIGKEDAEKTQRETPKM